MGGWEGLVGPAPHKQWMRQLRTAESHAATIQQRAWKLCAAACQECYAAAACRGGSASTSTNSARLYNALQLCRLAVQRSLHTLQMSYPD